MLSEVPLASGIVTIIVIAMSNQRTSLSLGVWGWSGVRGKGSAAVRHGCCGVTRRQLQSRKGSACFVGLGTGGQTAVGLRRHSSVFS